MPGNSTRGSRRRRDREALIASPHEPSHVTAEQKAAECEKEPFSLEHLENSIPGLISACQDAAGSQGKELESEYYQMYEMP